MSTVSIRVRAKLIRSLHDWTMHVWITGEGETEMEEPTAVISGFPSREAGIQRLHEAMRDLVSEKGGAVYDLLRPKGSA